MSFERLKGFARTLRFRLLAWNTGVVLFMVLTTLFLVREFVYRTLYVEFDQLLREDAHEVELTLQKFYRQHDHGFPDLELKAQGHAYREWFVQVFDAQGTPVWASSTAPKLPPPRDTPERFRFGEADHLRYVVQRVPLDGQPAVLVRVGASLHGLEEDVALLTRTVVIAGLLILVLAPLGGYWLSGRATRPLAKIIQKTGGLRPSNLAERLTLRGTGDELDQLSQTINGLLDRLALYVSQKHDVLANAAHELRSPLAAIRSSAEIALTRPRTSEEYTTLLADIMEECSGLEALVNQLLILAAGEAGELVKHPQPVALTPIVRRSLAMFEGAAEAAGLQLEAPRLDEVTVRGEEGHLRQVVNNLIDNAIKFSAAGDRVTVELAAEHGSAVLAVRDTGMGIAAEDLPRIFERFYQGDKARPRTDGRRGTGLGLSICHVIVTALGGQLTVESRPGEGSVFRVFLPLAAAPVTAIRSAGRRRPAS